LIKKKCFITAAGTSFFCFFLANKNLGFLLARKKQKSKKKKKLLCSKASLPSFFQKVTGIKNINLKHTKF